MRRFTGGGWLCIQQHPRARASIVCVTHALSAGGNILELPCFIIFR